MSRRIVTVSEQAAGAGEPLDGYFEKILKYVPADIVAAWLAADALIDTADEDNPKTLKWIVFAFVLVVTPFWVHKRTAAAGKPPARTQIIVGTLAFVVWVLAIGGPFAEHGWYEPLYGGLAMIGFLLVAALVTPPPGESG